MALWHNMQQQGQHACAVKLNLFGDPLVKGVVQRRIGTMGPGK